MNYVQSISKSLGVGTALLLAVIAGTVAGTAIPARSQSYNVLYDFKVGTSGPPGEPAGLVAQGQDGNLYGYSSAGGMSMACKMRGCGTIYRMGTSEGSTPVVLYSFPTYDDCGLGLTLGTDGNFYGACTKNGQYNHGYLFQFIVSGNQFNSLYSFCRMLKCADGGTPSSRPIEGATPGTFYGTTLNGGQHGYGEVYQITPPGLPTVLHSFTNAPPNLRYPNGPLLLGTDGNLYGTTQAGTDSSIPPFPICPPRCGAVYYEPAAGGMPTVLHTFGGQPSDDGATPSRGVIEGSDLNFYGTTVQGGTANMGTIFQMDPTGNVTYLYSFTTEDYGHPRGLAELPYLNFYGDANGCTIAKGCIDDGTVFEFTTMSGFTPTVPLSGKAGMYPGAYPDSTLSHTNGTLYGVTGTGGEYNDGVFYSLTVSEALTPAPAFCRPQLIFGQEGNPAFILGQGFSISSVVKFGGVQAAQIMVNETGTFITATIPTGAQTGPVTVTTGSTTLNSLLPFQVLPTITGLTPTSGPVGTLVTITGTALMQTTQVTFGGVNAPNVTVNSDTQVTATVPTGAVTGTIDITTPGGKAVSASDFTVTN